MINIEKNFRMPVSIFLCFQLLSCANSLSGNSKEEEELFEQIKVGMHKDDVIKILGEPDSKFIDSTSDKHYHYYYFTKSKWGRSELPHVSFDSTDRVTSSYYY